MKFKVGTFTTEGFVRAFALQAENDLILRTHPDMVFSSRDEKDEIMKKFQELVASLEALGVEIEGKEKIKR